MNAMSRTPIQIRKGCANVEGGESGEWMRPDGSQHLGCLVLLLTDEKGDRVDSVQILLVFLELCIEEVQEAMFVSKPTVGDDREVHE